MYRQVRYHRRTAAEIQRLIFAATRQPAGVRRVFLADGDVMRRPYDELCMILETLGQRLPDLARVNVYATGSAVVAKTDAQLRALRALKLQTLYLGLESGDEETLRRVCKGEDVATLVAAVQRSQACGLKMSVMVLLGLGGQERTGAHAEATAEVLNRMQPRLLSALRVVPVPGTELHQAVHAGRFQELSERGVIEELRSMLARLELTNTVFRANHSSNIVPLEARFPRDQQTVLAQLDALLAARVLDANSPGPQPMWL